MSPPIASRQAQLPLELVSRIVETAWTDTSSGESRYDLYDALSAAHPCLHAIVTEIANRNVIFDLGPGQQRDFQLYLDVRSLLSSLTNSDPTRPGQQEGYSRTHVRVDSYVDKQTIGRPRMLPGNGSAQMGSLVTAVVRDCASFTLNYDFSREAALGYDSTTLAIAANAVPDLSFLTTFPSLTSLHIHHRLPHLPLGWVLRITGVPRFGALTSLHLWEFPRCECTAYRSLAGQHTKDCLPGCLLTHFARIFPNIHSLQIDTPVSLRAVDVPHTLKTLTVEAPPIPYEYDGPARGSLLQWELGAALHGGFMRWEDGPVLREIIVRTFARDPEGWEEAVEASARYGVGLRRCEY